MNEWMEVKFWFSFWSLWFPSRRALFFLNTTKFIAMRCFVVVQRHKSSQIQNHSKVTANSLGMRRRARSFYLFDVAAKLFTSFTTKGEREMASGCSGMNFDAAFNSIWSARGAQAATFKGFSNGKLMACHERFTVPFKLLDAGKIAPLSASKLSPCIPLRCMHHVKFNFKAHTVHNKYRWRMRLHRTECMLKINYYFPSLFMLKNSQHKQVMYGKSATRSPRKQSFATYLLICYSELQQGEREAKNVFLC